MSLPGCTAVMISLPEGLSRQMKGTFFGTPGGAEPPFTPTVMACTPSSTKMGMAFLVMPGTSLCSRKWSSPSELVGKHC